MQGTGSDPTTRARWVGPDQPLHDALEALADAMGARFARASPIAWGDAGATHRVDFEDGRRVAARLVEPTRRESTMLAARRMTAAGQAGLPVPVPTLVDVDGTVWFVTSWIDGDVGARWLDTPERAQALARAMGTLLRSVRAIEPPMAEPQALDRGSSSNRLHDRGELDATVAAALDRADEILADRASAPAVFVHGDFAPINAIVGEDGEIRALLDFEHARSGDPLDDVAWWGWVVRHHHPDAWRAAWGTFCTASDVDLDRDERLLRARMLVQLFCRTVDASDGAARQGWLERLAEAAAW